MDFFEHQAAAQRRSRHLLLLFALAVIAIVLAVNAVIGLMLAGQRPLLDVLLSEAGLWTTLVTLLVIAVGSGLQMAQLSKGGAAIAEMVGARRVLTETDDPDERRLLNVCEEMAIASGAAVPRVFVMDDEPGLNAFVAGLSPKEAILVVTAGALKQFNRHELQGVVAHEFSHIFHGDMRLNMRLMGWLAGILLIGQFGLFLLRTGSDSSRWLRARKNNPAVAVLGLGLALTLIGYIGVFFGRLIKAAVSRQREFLADASAVQYTRDSSGLAGALGKIAAQNGQGQLLGAYRDDLSHFCFASPLKSRFADALGGWLSTHPPLEKRLQALGNVPLPATPATRAPQAPIRRPLSAASAAAIGSIGFVSEHTVRAAEASRSHWPEAVRHAAQDRLQIGALMIALLMQDQHNEPARDALAETMFADDPTLRAQVCVLHRALANVAANERFSVLLTTRNTLEQLTAPQKQALLQQLHNLAEMDQWLTRYECCLLMVLRAWLLPLQADKKSVTRFAQVADELAMVCGFVVQASCAQIGVQQAQFTGALASFGVPARPLPGSFDAGQFTQALTNLNACAPLLKRSLMTTLAELVLADRAVTVTEQEMLRAIAESLGCPMPPLNGLALK